MTGPDESPLTAIGGLDPTLRDAPPAPGSPRYQAILETAMTQTTLLPTPATGRPAPTRPARPARRRWVFAGSAVTAVAAALAAVVVLAPGGSKQSPSAVVLTAADHLGAVAGLRADSTYTDRLGQVTRSTIEVDGATARIVDHRSAADGGTLTVTLIGGRRYAQAGGNLSSMPATGDNSLAPYPDAARDVVTAVVGDSAVTRAGTDDVRGTKSTHYHLDMSGTAQHKLSRLPVTELAWFDLDSPQDVRSLDVWVAGGTLRRVTMTATFGTTDTVLYDLGAAITITAPTR
jgi:hypothetical protein